MDTARLAWWRVQTGLFYDIGFDGHRSLLRWLMKEASLVIEVYFVFVSYQLT